MSRFLLLILGRLALAASSALGQAAPPVRARPARPSAPPARPTRPAAPADSLTQLITRLDAQAFAAYNAHDVEGLMAFFAPDVEFFHDTGGLSTFSQTRQGFASVPNAADGLVSTIGDYAAFGAWVLAGAGLSDSLFYLMATPQVVTGPPGQGQGMSLGWQVLPIHNRPGDDYVLLHSGRDEGLFTLIVLLPRSRRGVVIFTNGDRGADVAVPVLRALLNLPELTP